MSRRTRISILCLALAGTAGSLLSATDARADTQDAMQHYQRGVELFGEGAYDAALVEFERAYKIAPTYKLLFNIAQVNRQLNDYARALDAYDRYLRDGGAEVPAARRAEVRAEMAKMSTRVARLDVKTNATQAEVSVDDAAVGAYPLREPLIVNVGKRKVSVKDPAGAVQTKIVDVVAGETVRVDLAFAEVAPSNASTTSPVVAERPGFPAVPWVVTGVLLAGGAVTGIVALGKSSDAKALERAPAASASGPDTAPDLNARIASSRDSAKKLGIATDVLLGCTIVSAAISTYLTVRYFRGKEQGPVSAALAPTLGGAVVMGSF